MQSWGDRMGGGTWLDTILTALIVVAVVILIVLAIVLIVVLFQPKGKRRPMPTFTMPSGPLLLKYGYRLNMAASGYV